MVKAWNWSSWSGSSKSGGCVCKWWSVVAALRLCDGLVVCCVRALVCLCVRNPNDERDAWWSWLRAAVIPVKSETKDWRRREWAWCTMCVGVRVFPFCLFFISLIYYYYFLSQISSTFGSDRAKMNPIQLD